jgi:hypothetical protein
VDCPRPGEINRARHRERLVSHGRGADGQLSVDSRIRAAQDFGGPEGRGDAAGVHRGGRQAPRHKATRMARRERWIKRRRMGMGAPLCVEVRHPGDPAFRLACELIECFLSADGNRP